MTLVHIVFLTNRQYQFNCDYYSYDPQNNLFTWGNYDGLKEEYKIDTIFDIFEVVFVDGERYRYPIIVEMIPNDTNDNW